MVLDVNKKYLKEEQYKSSKNLSARIVIHQKFRTNPESFYGWIWKNYEIKNSLKILEIGCGTGEFWLENYSKLPWRLFGETAIYLTHMPGLLSLSASVLQHRQHPSGRQWRCTVSGAG